MIIVLIVLCSTSMTFAQEWVRQLFPVRDHDFGTVPRGAKTYHRFEITNPYEEEIHFGKATSSCTCTTPIIETPVLKSFETGAVLVHFNTDRESGHQKATINITIEKPFPAIATIQIRGHIRGDVTFEPSIVLFSSVPVGEGREKTVKIVYQGTNSFWSVRRVESANPNISVEIGKTTPQRRRIEVELTIKLDKNAPVGRLSERVFLITSDANAGHIPLQIEGEVLAPIRVRPEQHSFGTVYEENTLTRPIPIVLSGDKPFLVKRLTASETMYENGVTITAHPQNPIDGEPKSTYIFHLNFTAPKVGEPKSICEKIVFVTDHPEITPTLTILAVVKPRDKE